jgi:hypothetical protein
MRREESVERDSAFHAPRQADQIAAGEQEPGGRGEIMEGADQRLNTPGGL